MRTPTTDGYLCVDVQDVVLGNVGELRVRALGGRGVRVDGRLRRSVESAVRRLGLAHARQFPLDVLVVDERYLRVVLRLAVLQMHAL